MIRSLGYGFSAALLVLLALLVASPPASAAETRVPLPHPAPAHIGNQCVEPVDLMRREHMNFLRHQRDDTVRSGVRGNKYSLRGCVECHAVADAEAGGARTVRNFCSECHNYAAVKIDCFECHTTKAETALNSFLPTNGGQTTAKAFANLGAGLKTSALFAEVECYLNKRSAHNS